MFKKIIDIVAPAYPLTIDLKKIKDAVQQFGYQARIPENIQADHADLFCANSDEIRFHQLKEALFAEDSDIIWAFRGGYGSARIMDEILKLPKPPKPKLLIGYSDITVLHILVNQLYNWPSIHGRTISEYARKIGGEQDFDRMVDMLHNRSACYNNLMPLNEAAEAFDEIEAKIVGGNLSLIQTSIGTKWQLHTKNKIILLEDTGERGYNIDRILNHLQQAGIFKDAAAIIFGTLLCSKERDGSELCGAAVNRFALKQDIPVLSCPTIGHSIDNWPIALNVKCTLTLGENPLLEVAKPWK